MTLYLVCPTLAFTKTGRLEKAMISGQHISHSRRYDIDWLRVFATYLLFPLHVSMVFGPALFYHIRNDPVSFGVSVLVRFILLWHMSLFFVLAGWSMFSSLQARGCGRFLKERVRKLVIPLLVGCVIFGPPIKYLELRSGLDANHWGLFVSAELQESFKPFVPPEELRIAPPFDESFFEFLPTFFTRFERFTWSHLWFLGYLLTFTVLYLPLFSWLIRTRRSFTGRGRAWVYLPVIPLALIEFTLRPHWPTRWNLYADWANFACYSTYLIAGFLLARYPALEQAAHREWKRALSLGLGGLVLWLLSVLGVITSPALLSVGVACAGWGIIVALLGVARSRFTHTNSVLDYLKESAYPVYILHQAAIVCIGYWIIQLSLGMAAKYTLLLAASFVVTLLVYQFIVRPISILRSAFGMKPIPRKVVPAEKSAMTFASK